MSKIKQPVVVKASFNNYSEAEQAFTSVTFKELRGYIETNGGPRVVFLVESINQAITHAKHLVVKPTQVQVFDPSALPAEGWPQLVTLDLD
jgi:hypothetical protein